MVRFASLVFTAGLFLFAADAEAAKPECGDGECRGNETQQTCPQDCGPADVCGDAVCSPTESCSSCEVDCGACPPDVCGDAICGATETCSSCETDCGPCAACNHDGICNDNENCLACSDCPGRTSGNPRNRFCCGEDTCATAQCGANACAPVPVCGNGDLEYSEECDDANTSPGDGCDAFCVLEPISTPAPLNQFNIGDSIGEAEAANGTIGAANHDRVWSTGYATGDSVNAINERLEVLGGAAYYENNSTRDPFFNQAISGSVMADFVSQAQAVADAAAEVPDDTAGMVTVFLGNNDVCADTLAEMTDPDMFEAQYRAGLDVLAGAQFNDDILVHVSGIPAIYWLWNARRNDLVCRLIWPFVPCGNLLDNAADDCASSTSRLDPDNDYAGDGPNCQRRKAFHAAIRDVYNPILSNVLAEYQADGRLPNAEYIDIFDIQFSSSHVNSGDCFHPSTAGHALLAEEEWCRSRWGQEDATCTP